MRKLFDDFRTSGVRRENMEHFDSCWTTKDLRGLSVSCVLSWNNGEPMDLSVGTVDQQLNASQEDSGLILFPSLSRIKEVSRRTR